MSIDVKFEDVKAAIPPLTPAVAQKYFDAAKKILTVVSGLSALLPFKEASIITGGIAAAMNFVEPHLNDPLLYSIINGVIQLLPANLTPATVAQTLQHLEAAVTHAVALKSAA